MMEIVVHLPYDYCTIFVKKYSFSIGKVYKGQLVPTGGDKTFVAVKALKENASYKTQQDFRREIELISDLKHENIVCILGVVLNKEPFCMLFEYMSNGDLHEFLIANSPNENKFLTQLEFLKIALQISEGMEYLSNHHYVHRDLAARNCLVGDDLMVKISDFGLSRDIYSSDYYRFVRFCFFGYYITLCSSTGFNQNRCYRFVGCRLNQFYMVNLPLKAMFGHSELFYGKSTVTACKYERQWRVNIVK